MQRRVAGNHRGLRGRVVGAGAGGGATGPSRVGGLGPRAPVPRRTVVGMDFSLSVAASLSLHFEGGSAKNRGGAGYDPARRVPRVSSYALPAPRLITSRGRTAVVYCREFFAWRSNHPTPNSFLCGLLSLLVVSSYQQRNILEP